MLKRLLSDGKDNVSPGRGTAGVILLSSREKVEEAKKLAETSCKSCSEKKNMKHTTLGRRDYKAEQAFTVNPRFVDKARAIPARLRTSRQIEALPPP